MVTDWIIIQLPFSFLSYISYFFFKSLFMYKEKSRLIQSRNQSNAGQDSTETTGKGPGSRWRRGKIQAGGWGISKAESSIHSMYINTVLSQVYTSLS